MAKKSKIQYQSMPCGSPKQAFVSLGQNSGEGKRPYKVRLTYDAGNDCLSKNIIVVSDSLPGAIGRVLENLPFSDIKTSDVVRVEAYFNNDDELML